MSEVPRPQKTATPEVRRGKEWKAPFEKCIVCAPIPGRELGTCRWFGESAVGAPAVESGVAASEGSGGGELVDDGIVANDCSLLTDADEVQPGRMTKAEEAHTDVHMRTHKPYNEYCVVCDRAKSPNKKAFNNSFKRDIDHFGQIVTLDHTHPFR